jgi:hypothetical protein
LSAVTRGIIIRVRTMTTLVPMTFAIIIADVIIAKAGKRGRR